MITAKELDFVVGSVIRSKVEVVEVPAWNFQVRCYGWVGGGVSPWPAVL